MKYKTHCRLFGLYQTTLSSALGSAIGTYTILSDGPLWTKLGTGIVTSLTALVTIDGVVDIVKGLHHYFGLQLWRYASHSEKNAKAIDDSICAMRYWRNREMSEVQQFKRKS